MPTLDTFLSLFRSRVVSLTGTGSRRDPATRLVASGRILWLDENAKKIDVKPQWGHGRRTRKDARTGRVYPLPRELTIPVGDLTGVTYRPSRWCRPGRLTIHTTTGMCDPWRWALPDRLPISVTWWLSRKKEKQAFTLQRRLTWARDMANRRR